ncbi:hypothetical protein [Flavobacterium sp. N2270]|uniref:hypothetical protein n=1 Tax=Flavobacterium sp. N2270 TaxID=2986831 RepID=UPI0022243AEF|nr:hypothetical protein [Flavobacterium sp. N2270]
MSILKRFLFYFTWALVAFLAAFIYMRIILGPKPESTSVLMTMFSLFYDYAFLHIGLIIGSIITLLFILIDVLYLKGKLKFGMKSLFIRFFILIFITVIVAFIHYLLEKVIDVI